MDALATEAYSVVYKTFKPPPRFVYALAKIAYSKFLKQREMGLRQKREDIRTQEEVVGYKPIIRRRNPASRKTVKRADHYRRRNPDVDEIELNFSEINKMAKSLRVWNLKYASFPDLKKWIDNNYTLGNGEEKDIIYKYLSSIPEQRAASYWGIQPWGTQGKGIEERYDENYKNFKKLLKKYNAEGVFFWS